MNALVPHPALASRPEAGRELCQLVSDWTGRMPAGGAIVEPKVDGIRALWIDGELVTREGAPIHGAEHIAACLRWLEHEACVPMFFDGEWQVGGSFAATLAHFQARGGRGDAGTLHLFDAMPMRVWRGEDPGQALEDRRPKLDRLLDGKARGAVRALPWAWASDADEVAAQAREYIAGGGEGVVVKNPLATYRRARTSEWQRIKKAMSLDLRIVDAVPQKEREWMLGALVLDYRGKRVRVAAGFSDVERMALWRDRASLVGTMAEVEAMEVTESGALRQARFVRLRLDKENDLCAR